MNTLDPSSQPEPFSEPLSPLPAADEGSSECGKPDDLPVTPTETEIPNIASEDAGKMEIHAAKPRRRWGIFRRKPSAREQQLAILQQGCTEMVGLMRSIRDHLHDEQAERSGLRKTLSPLPLAMESLKTMNENQVQTGAMLGQLTTHVARSTEKDKMLIGSFDRFNDTMTNANDTFDSMGKSLKSFEKTSQRSLQTMQALGQRVEESDRFLGETFARLRDAEHEFTDQITKASKRSSFVTVSLCALLSVTIAVLAVAFHQGTQQWANFRTPQMNGMLVHAIPTSNAPNRALAMEDLGRDDGIEEPDREIVQGDGAVTVPDVGPVEGPLDFNRTPEETPFSFDEAPGGLLSITEPPKR